MPVPSNTASARRFFFPPLFAFRLRPGEFAAGAKTANVIANGVACGVAAANDTPCTPRILLAPRCASTRAEGHDRASRREGGCDRPHACRDARRRAGFATALPTSGSRRRSSTWPRATPPPLRPLGDVRGAASIGARRPPPLRRPLRRRPPPHLPVQSSGSSGRSNGAPASLTSPTYCARAHRAHPSCDGPALVFAVESVSPMKTSSPSPPRWQMPPRGYDRRVVARVKTLHDDYQRRPSRFGLVSFIAQALVLHHRASAHDGASAVARTHAPHRALHGGLRRLWLVGCAR